MHNCVSVSACKNTQVFKRTSLVERIGARLTENCRKIPTYLSIDLAHLLDCGLFFMSGENIAKFSKNTSDVAIGGWRTL